MIQNGTVIDVTEATFARDVLERSREVPVVVDFWAAWCGPCRMLGPVLERLAAEADGEWILAKLDVDQAPQLSAQYGIQGIPAVKAFRDGRVVAQFVGAQPEPNVRRWLATIAPTPTEQLLDQAADLEDAGDWSAAVSTYRQALALSPHDTAASLGLGRALLLLGQTDEATAVLQSIADDVDLGGEARGLLTQAQLAHDAAVVGGEAGARARLAENPNDPEALYGLAAALVAEEDYRGALDALLTLVRRQRRWRDEAGRKTMLGLFELLGDADPLTQEYRSKLSQALF